MYAKHPPYEAGVFVCGAGMITRRQFIDRPRRRRRGELGLGGYAFALEPRFRLVVTEWDLPTARWPHAQPLKIVIVTDIHACRPWMPPERIRAIVEKANALGGDIIVVLGDFVSGHRPAQAGGGGVAAAEWGPALAGLRAPLGVHAILGNHDWWSDLEAVKDALAAPNIPLYQNRAEKIEGAAPFWLAGTDSMVAHPLGHGRFRGADDLPGTLAQITDDAPGHPDGARARPLRRRPGPLRRDAQRPYAWRPGALPFSAGRWCPPPTASASPMATSARRGAT